MVMRIILTPRGMNDPLVRALTNDKVASNLLPERKESKVVICQDGVERKEIKVVICQDGWTPSLRVDVSKLQETTYLQKLFDNCFDGVRLRFENISFDDGDFVANLSDADIFYFKGFGGGMAQVREIFSNPHYQDSIREVARKVMYNQMVYFGVCGGAIVAGRDWIGPDFGTVTFLDCLGGLSVRYTPSVPASSVQIIEWDDRLVEVTDGCGVAMHVEEGFARASCFIAVKKRKSTWWSYQEANTRKVQRQAEGFLTSFSRYQHRGRLWWFRMDVEVQL